MVINYNELKKKDVVDISNGKNLGKIIDLVIEVDCGKILKLIVTGKKNGLFFCEELQIGYNQIKKIGDDAILVKLCEEKPCIKKEERIDTLDE